MLTAEQARALFDYDEETGALTFKNTGKEAGRLDRYGYRIVTIRVTFCEHRLAWLLANGEWPKGQIDHINRDKADNRIENLRECTNAENHQNLPMLSTNSSGFVGVTWNKSCSKWQAQIRAKGKSKYLGVFSSAEEAAEAYAAAKRQLHTFHPHITK